MFWPADLAVSEELDEMLSWFLCNEEIGELASQDFVAPCCHHSYSETIDVISDHCIYAEKGFCMVMLIHQCMRG